jgi:hypothetical protein
MKSGVNQLLLADDEWQNRGVGSGFISRVRKLLEQQKETWPLLRSAHESLARARIRTVAVGGVEMVLQHNPARLNSATAETDPKKLKTRPCFLCADQLHNEQRALLFDDAYYVLCNPFPILPDHLTIALHEHLPQKLNGAVTPMLKLARELYPSFIVVYNGPAAGASAPDHMHFQAGDKDSLPLVRALPALLQDVEPAPVAGNTTMKEVDSPFFRFIVLSSEDAGSIERSVKFVTGNLESDGGMEPKMNIAVWFEQGQWTVVIFPRKKHRPSMYYANGPTRLLLSPAAIDCMGFFALPRAVDFDRVTADVILEVFTEIFPSSEEFRTIVARIRERALKRNA